MRWRSVKTVIADITEIGDMLYDALMNFGRELAELGEDPVRTRQGIVAACSVMLATFLALLLEIEAPWWAAISGFMSLMSTGAGSLRRGLLRLTGTAAGSLLGFIMARWLPYDQVALYLFIAEITMLGVIAMQVSPHGLAWLFFSITTIMVLLAILSDPLQAVTTAYYRMFEVGIGVLSALIVADLLQDWHADPPPQAPGWRHLLDAQWPAFLHGIRSAIAVIGVLWIWILIDLPQVTTMALTVTMGDGGAGSRRWRPGQWGRHRRAIAAPPFGLPARRPRGAGLPGAGCDVVSVVARDDRRRRVDRHAHTDGPARRRLCRDPSRLRFHRHDDPGSRPPTSILPGIDRFAGIAGGLAILWIVSLLMWPSDKDPDRG
jgi:hypothetical protein